MFEWNLPKDSVETFLKNLMNGGMFTKDEAKELNVNKSSNFVLKIKLAFILVRIE